MICNRFSFGGKRGAMTGFRLFILSVLLFLSGMLTGCNTSDDSGDGDTESGTWTLVSRYFYDYDSDGLLIKETDDNNANNIADTGDQTWYHDYDADGVRTGYQMYKDGRISGDPDGIGTYFYDSNDCNYRLEEESPQGTNLKVWTYTVDDDCKRLSYYYDGEGETETGTYIRDADGNVIRLNIDNGDYWEYSIDTDGNRDRYDYYQGGKLNRYGLYYYIGDQLDELRNYEKR